MTSTPTASALDLENPNAIYTRVFWLSYAANLALVMGNALTFRFAEFVAYLGGTERISGTIVGTAICAALVVRLVLGQSIDRYGVRPLWLAGGVLFVFGNAAYLLCDRLSWLLVSARISYAIGLATMFTCSIVHIQNQVPTYRRTEIIASLGSSGFIGMIAGAQLGDWILNAFPEGRLRFVALFGGATALGVLYAGAVLYLTWHETHARPHETPPVHRLMFRYWPGWVIVVALIMGACYSVITVFLTRFATHQGLRGIGTFFTGYASAAFVVRILTRRWSESVGRHRMILIGLCGHFIGYSTLPFVTAEWHFVFPSVCCGWGHALLFPAVVSRGAGAFPVRYRGSGTTLVLGFFDLGSALSAPILGGIIDYFDGAGFSQMFFATGGAALFVAILYGLTAARKPDVDHVEAHDAAGAAADETLETDEPEDEPVTAPFPHLGRMA
jgi:MFS family permease